MADITEVPPPGKRKTPMRELLETVILAILIAVVVRTFVVEVYRVQGTSMETTLHNDERVLVNKFLFKLVRQPEPGDVIVFQYPRQPDRDFIKRVVAVAGDRVEMREGKVYVNGQPFPEAPGVRLSDEDLEGVKVVPADNVWVLGDNRSNSEDSRYFGPVPLENIRGLAFVRIWPLQRICGFVNPVDLAVGGKELGGFACP
jgi:signal peptidase I